MANEWFAGQLKTALVCLYDPTALRSSPLVELLGVSQHRDPTAGLRSALTASIESLRPSGNTPHESRAWRVYQILRRRYIEGLGQRQIAADLGLGVRQLQREEKLARELLAEQLWDAYGLQKKAPPDADAALDDECEAQDEPAEDPVAEELAWLRSSVPVQLTDLTELVTDVLKTVEPLTQRSSVAVICRLPQAAPAPVRAPVLRQALLDIVGTVLGCAAGGRLSIEVRCAPRSVRIALRAHAGGSGIEAPAGFSESLAMAERLVQVCDGALEVTTPAEKVLDPLLVFSAQLAIPVIPQQSVLVIDDNADSLQLIQRYLAGSPYLFIGAQDARRGLELAVQQPPSAVLLDIMMPAQDGWSVLAQLREHLQTRDIPVIVCTLLSQRDLALALGAAGFLRKPVSRPELLATLDQLLAPAPSGP